MKAKQIVLAVTGASGSVYARLLINKLHALQHNGEIDDVAVVFSDTGKEVWNYELKVPINSIPFNIYDNSNFNAPFASGSSLYDTMIICPCSMGTMGYIANGLANSLITRAADVILKERRQLILAVRETPIHLIHINNMKTLVQTGAIIAPASPSFYSLPDTIEELALTVVDRILQLAGLQTDTYRWGSHLL